MVKKILCLSALVMTGCSTLNYEEPIDGPTAQVRFVSSSSEVTVLWRYDDANCNGEQEWMRLRDGFLLNSEPRSLDMPLSNDLHENAFKELNVEANVDHVFMFKSVTTSGMQEYHCAVPVKVNFEPNQMYELAFFSYGATCTLDVTRIVEQPDGSAQKASYFANDKVSTFGKQCEEAFEKSRLY